MDRFQTEFKSKSAIITNLLKIMTLKSLFTSFDKIKAASEIRSNYYNIADGANMEHFLHAKN